ncbi:MAG: thioredoxin [Myxococcales bacterium]|nr:thioredoxin [Myxococcales bacterium]
MGHKPITITLSNFKSTVLESDLPIVLDFWAPWCGPCRAIAPILDALAGAYEGKVKVGKINVDEEGALAQQFQITGIPTLVVFHAGKNQGRLVGFPGRQGMNELFEQLAALTPAQSAAR